MSNQYPLVVGFVERAPRTAAKALAAMGPDRSAAILETLSRRQAATLVAHMSALSAATAVGSMQPSSAAALLEELDYQSAAALARLLPDDERSKLLAMLPRKLARDLRMTLNYPANTVGSKMNVLVATVGETSTVAEALSELRLIKRMRTGVAFVVDDTRKLLGVVNASDLLQLMHESPITEVMDRTVTPVAARARLATVGSLPSWDDFPQLPVVDRRGRVVGALSRRVAIRSRREADSGALASSAEQPTVLGAIVGAFVACVVGVGELLLDIDNP